MTEDDFRADVIDRLARIETSVDLRSDHEKRIRGIERKQWFLSGAGSAIGLVLGFVTKGNFG